MKPFVLSLLVFLIAVVPASAHGGDPYMIGSIAVSIIFPESIDGTEDWAQEEQALMVSEIEMAFDWWTARAVESGAEISWVYETHTISTIYEPIEMPHKVGGYELWIPDVLQLEGNWWDQANAYQADLRARHGTDWAFIIFCVDSSKDVDGRFADGWWAFARLGGEFAVMTYDNAIFGPTEAHRVAAHEIGHIFCAMDQMYAARQPCWHSSGYLNIQHQNSDYGDCLLSEPSIMKYATIRVWDEGLVDKYARGQIGWWDADCDDVLDPLDDYIGPNGCPVYRVALPIIWR